LLIPKQQIVIHHNHPSNGPLSEADISMLGLPGTAAVWAHGHAGNITRGALTDLGRSLMKTSTARSNVVDSSAKRNAAALGGLASRVGRLVFVLAVQFGERPLYREPRPDRTLGVILLRHGIAEQRHRPVPELLGDFAAHFHDGGRGGGDTGADWITPFLGVEFRRDSRRVHQVAKHHRDMAAFPHGFGWARRDRRRLRRFGGQPISKATL
jgi:hypothetical protein